MSAIADTTIKYTITSVITDTFRGNTPIPLPRHMEARHLAILPKPSLLRLKTIPSTGCHPIIPVFSFTLLFFLVFQPDFRKIQISASRNHSVIAHGLHRYIIRQHPIHSIFSLLRRHPLGCVGFAGFRGCRKDEAHKLWVGAVELERDALKRSTVLKNLDFARLSGAGRFKEADAL